MWTLYTVHSTLYIVQCRRRGRGGVWRYTGIIHLVPGHMSPHAQVSSSHDIKDYIEAIWSGEWWGTSWKWWHSSINYFNNTALSLRIDYRLIYILYKGYCQLVQSREKQRPHISSVKRKCSAFDWSMIMHGESPLETLAQVSSFLNSF